MNCGVSSPTFSDVLQNSCKGFGGLRNEFWKESANGHGIQNYTASSRTALSGLAVATNLLPLVVENDTAIVGFMDSAYSLSVKTALACDYA